MTRPDVIISGGDDAGGRPPLPAWVPVVVASVVVAGLLSVLGVHLADDWHRRQLETRASDRVEAVVRINLAGTGVDGTVVLAVQVSGRGGELHVAAPTLRPAQIGSLSIVGAPLVVAADQGNEVLLRLQPNCAGARSLSQLEVELPVTPASGKRHLLRVPFPEGPALVRRACGYLPLEDALTVTATAPRVVAGRLRLQLGVRNDSRELLTVTALQAGGLDVQARLPLRLPPGAPAEQVPVVVRVVDCAAVRAAAAASPPPQVTALQAQVADEAGLVHEVALPLDGPVAATLGSMLTARCP